VARIFLVLSVITVSLLAVSLIVGFTLGDYVGIARKLRSTLQELEAIKKEKDPDDPQRLAKVKEFEELASRFWPAKRHRTWHFYCGVIAALATVLLNSISVTYFMGTSRWCKEVGEAYSLSDELMEKSRRYKRETFPWSIGAILAILVVITFGAAADPGANFGQAHIWVTPHQIAAILASGFIALALFVQVGTIGRNYEVIEAIVAEVERIRTAKGLN